MGGDLLDRSDALDERIARAPNIADLVKASRRNRFLIWILSASMAFELLLSAGVGYLAWQARQTAAQANSIQAQARATCVAGNEARAGQMQLWHFLLDMPPTTPRTPEQQQQAVRFRVYVDKLFSPRRC